MVFLVRGVRILFFYWRGAWGLLSHLGTPHLPNQHPSNLATSSYQQRTQTHSIRGLPQNQGCWSVLAPQCLSLNTHRALHRHKHHQDKSTHRRLLTTLDLPKKWLRRFPLSCSVWWWGSVVRLVAATSVPQTTTLNPPLFTHFFL